MSARYLEVKNHLIHKINEGFYKAGDKIPSERALSEEYGVSRMTARQAVSALVIDGVVYRETSKGTFVSTKQFSQKNVKSFTQTLMDQGFEPFTEIIEFAKVHSLGEISTVMGLPYETSYFKIKRLRYGNGVPMALETIYLPVEKCQGLKVEDIGQSLYEALEAKFGYVVGRVSNDIDACISSRIMMHLFKVQKPVALLRITGVSYTTEGEMLFYEDSYYRSDLYRYQVDIYKRK